jgi:L-ascorbate metabolism protein UlaG (beta-lactamase superfamily)
MLHAATARAIGQCALAIAMSLGFTHAGAQAPRDEQGFRNNYPHEAKASFWEWKWRQLSEGLPQPPPGGWNLPSVHTDPGTLAAPASNPSMTWIGHATVLVRLAGRNVLFDPIFSTYASPVPPFGPKRVVPLPIDVDELPKIDVVMISHNHYDHLDFESVRRLAAMPQGSPRFLVPLGLKAWFEDRGITRVDEYDWWQSTEEGALRITLVPVQHWSRRTLTDTNATLWGGWVVEGEGFRIIHAGDAGYSQDFRDIGERFGAFDMAFLPIGSYAPRWFMRVNHLDVPEAVQVRADLNAARAIGIHWGTFESLADEPLDEPPRVLARQREARGLSVDQFDVMKIGETRPLK